VLDCDAEKFEKYKPLLDKMSLTLADHETEPLEEDAADGPMSEESDGPEE
jgi:hypothetical protein